MTSKVAPEATVTTVPSPSEVEEPSFSVPAETVRPPVKLLLPLSVTTPVPALTTAKLAVPSCKLPA